MPLGLHPATHGFDTAAERYERGRPDYPAEAVDWLVDQLGRDAPAGARVLDIGAGTGKQVRRLLKRGYQVIAIEPVAGMRAIPTRTAPAADVGAGQAEALPLGAAQVDAVVVGQAFHWFATAAALAEFAHGLRPGGWLGLIWNMRSQAAAAGSDRLFGRALPKGRPLARQ